MSSTHVIKIGAVAIIFLLLVGVVVFFRISIGEFLWLQFRDEEIALFVSGNDLELKRDIATYYFNQGAYDPIKAEHFYEELYEDGYDSHFILYQLGRVYFVNNKLSEAQAVLSEQLLRYPEEKRAHYVRGLTNIYLGSFNKAIEDFEAFVEWSPEEWAGHNDLAWAYIKNGEYEKSAEVSSKALQQFPDNLWLHNLLGVALWNLNSLEDAQRHFETAQRLAADLTEGEWGGAYPGNDPATYGSSLDAMREAIADNLKGVREEIEAAS